MKTATFTTIFTLLSSGIFHAAEIIKISASSAQAGNPAAAALDDLPGTRWAAEGDGEWIATGFNAPVKIDSVSIGFHNGNRQYSFDIEVTNDGDSWENLGSFTSAGKSNNPETFRFKASSASQLRVISKGSNANKWINIHTLRIPGTKISGKLVKVAAKPAPVPGPAG
ncbi:MAG: discoidin domain-containing protein, partial [Verrucomicrobiota bacterium]|nr:discoidin domain-containing protein [Verrucomicrobiota bacterium]